MYFPASRPLLQSIMAGALVFAGATACNQGDRTETGSDTRGADVAPDTAMTGTGQNYGTGTGATGMTPGTGTDTVSAGARAVPGTAMGDTAPAEIQSRRSGESEAAQSAGRQDTSATGDTTAAGYRAMERDTAKMQQDSDTARMSGDTTGGASMPQDSDTARVTTDTSEVSGAALDTGEVSRAADTAAPVQARVDTTSGETELAVGADVYGDTLAAVGVAESPEAEADTAAAGYAAMARDTSVITDQSDTSAAAAAGNEALEARVDTTQPETGVAAEADVHGDTLGAAVLVDTTENAGRIRPPEDSAEVYGQVTADTNTIVARADTIESEPIRPPEDSTQIAGSVTGDETADERPLSPDEIRSDDRETVAASEGRTDEFGAATVTGVEAVALMSRQGARCEVVDPETDREVRWDMSSTPATLNPCGLGSMNLSRIWTEQR